MQLRAATITKRLLCLLYYSQTGCSLASNIAILSHNIAILIGRLFSAICKQREQIGRGLLAKIISLRGTNVGSTWFVVYLKGIIGTLPPKKFPSKKTCPLPRKWAFNDYPLLNCITAKKWLAYRKTYKNPHIRLLNSFLILQIVFPTRNFRKFIKAMKL